MDVRGIPPRQRRSLETQDHLRDLLGPAALDADLEAALARQMLALVRLHRARRGVIRAVIESKKMRSAEAWLEAYGECHRDPTNEAIHWQLVGHEIEGNRPSFFHDLQLLPSRQMWSLAHLLRRAGVRY